MPSVSLPYQDWLVIALLACYVFIVASGRAIPWSVFPVLLMQGVGFADSVAILDLSLQRSSMVAEITFYYRRTASLNYFLIYSINLYEN